MEFLYFAIVAITLYFVADRVLVAIERYLGQPLEQRSVVFFGIFLVLLVSTFAAVRYFID